MPKIDIDAYRSEPPPEPSANLRKWQERIRAGWRPNRRISQMGYEEKAYFFGVYVWEYLNVLRPTLYPETAGRE